MIDFKGRNVVLTGAGGGVGGALVEVLAACGARVVACDREGMDLDRPGIAGDREAAACHPPSGLGADRPVHGDVAVGHLDADAVETLAAALKLDLRGIARAQTEDVAKGHAFARGIQCNGRDLGLAQAFEPLWRERRQVEALRRLIAQSEHEGAHGSRSFRW